MPDNLRNSGPQDGKRINIHQEHEIDYWTDRLGVSRAVLRAIVAQVGTYAVDVRAHLAATKGDDHEADAGDSGPGADPVDAADPALKDQEPPPPSDDRWGVVDLSKELPPPALSDDDLPADFPDDARLRFRDDDGA